MNEISNRRRRAWLPAVIPIALVVSWGCEDGSESVVEEIAPVLEAGVIVLDSTQIAVANIVVAPVDTTGNAGLSATGTITYDANRVSHVGPRTSGRIVTLFVDVGQTVRSGQPLAMLESPEIGQIRAELHEAEALVRIASENYERETRLQGQGISSRREVLEAEAELRRAEAALAGAQERLEALGAGQGEGGEFSLTAPFAGVVVERDASLGEMANSENQLFTVADLDRLWIELDIYERDLSRVARGQGVEVTTAAYPGRAFPGTIAYVSDIMDSDRRTIRARVEIPNQDRALRPGMFATARIAVTGPVSAVVIVGQEAVQEMSGRTVVFVPGSRAGEFRVQAVVVGEQDDQGRVAIVSGLSPGDRIVVSGAFALRSELSRDEFAEDEP